jgi:hypothetical protein
VPSSSDDFDSALVQTSQAHLVPESAARDADAVAAWMRKTEGLAALEAPAAGGLAPRRGGWLVGLGALRRRLWPRLGHLVDIWTASMGSTLGTVALLDLATGKPEAAFSLGAAAVVSVVPIAIVHSVSVLRARRERARARTVENFGDVPSGTHVHLRGTVAPQPAMTSLARGVAAVVSRNRLKYVDETRAIDFWVELADGQRIRVDARRAILLDFPEPVREPADCGPVRLGFADTDIRHRVLRLQPEPMDGARWWQVVHTRLRESSVGPGDVIDLWGVLEHEPAPSGAGGGSSRNPALQPVLRAQGKIHLFVMRARANMPSGLRGAMNAR